MPDYWITLFNYIGISSLVAIGLVLLTGVGGMTSFGQAAFVGFGAYTTGVLTVHLGISPWLTLPASLVVTMVGGRPDRRGHACGFPATICRLAPSPGASPSSICSATWARLGAHDGLDGIPPLRIGSHRADRSARIFRGGLDRRRADRDRNAKPAGRPDRACDPRASAQHPRRRSVRRQYLRPPS